MKICFLDAKTVGELEVIKKLEEFGELKIYKATTPAQTLERVKGCDVVITNKVVIDKKIISKSSSLKLICVAATGTNNIDLEAARKAGIQVKNVKGYSTDGVAQHTFAMIFYLLNHLAFFSKYVNSGKYSKSTIFTSLDREITEIKGKTIGIIGLGTIGKRVAQIAEVFGAKVIYYSTSGKHDDKDFKRVSLAELLLQADIISIHAPLNEKTKGLIGIEELKEAKENCILINTGRGGIIKEKDLVRALDKGLIGGAAIDVFEKEPLAKSHPFMSIKNKEKLLLTPHVAWASIESRIQLVNGIYQNINDFVKPKS